MPGSRQPRIIEPEWMDHAPIEEAAHSLRDLDKINRWLGGWSTLRRVLRDVQSNGDSFLFADIGAGSAGTARQVERWYPAAKTISLDYRFEHIAQGTGVRCTGDAFRLPFRDASIDVVSSSLFLHHFEEPAVTDLLAEMRRVARRSVVIVDLERGPLAEKFMVWSRPVFGWHPITLHDAPISVRAGFKCPELERIARSAGFVQARVRVHRPWARLSLIGR